MYKISKPRTGRWPFSVLRILVLPWATGTLFFTLPAVAKSDDARSGFDIARYPRAVSLQIASVPVRVQPIREFRFVASTSGVIALNTDYSEGFLEEGERIGVIDGEKLEVERSLLDLNRKRFEQLGAMEWVLEQQGKRIQMEERLDRLRRQKEIFSRIKDEPEIMALFVREGEVDGLNGDETWDSRLSEIGAEMELVRRILAVPPEQIEHDWLESEELKLRQRELEFQRREEISVLQMPFTGLFKLNIPLQEDRNEYRVEANQLIGVAQDVSTLQALVPVRFSEWREMPAQKLQLHFGGGLLRRTMVTRFAATREMVVQGRPELFFEFQFDDADNSRARGYIGGSVSARLILELPEEARVIPKLDLARINPNAVRRMGWAHAVKEMLPEVRQVYVGESEIAVVMQ